jgi:hypothetical protein
MAMHIMLGVDAELLDQYTPNRNEDAAASVGSLDSQVRIVFQPAIFSSALPCITFPCPIRQEAILCQNEAELSHITANFFM